MLHNEPTLAEKTKEMAKRIDATTPSELRERNTIAQVAAFWGVSARTVRRLTETGRLNALQIGGVIRITRADVEAYEAANSTTARAKKDKEHADRMRAMLDQKRMARAIERARQERIKASPGRA